MFGLIEAELTPRPSPWERLRLSLRRETGVWVEEEQSFGTRMFRARIQFWCDDAPESSRRRAEAALAALRDKGVRGVVTPPGFIYMDLLPLYGLTAAAPAPLYRRLAARLAILAADRMGIPPVSLRVCFVAKRMTREVMSAMEALCSRARYMFLSLERGGGGDVCRLLRRNYGISVVENPSAEQVGSADAYLVFDCWGSGRFIPAKQGAVVLLLAGGSFVIPAGSSAADGAVLLPPPRLRDGWPCDADNEALLAALTAAGAVSPGEIRLHSLKMTNRCRTALQTKLHARTASRDES